MSTSRVYLVECSYCGKRFPRKRYSTKLRRHKPPWTCSGVALQDLLPLRRPPPPSRKILEFSTRRPFAPAVTDDLDVFGVGSDPAPARQYLLRFSAPLNRKMRPENEKAILSCGLWNSNFAMSPFCCQRANRTTRRFLMR
jgi:endogenous inhibitor of DNA gyrase (YacG/DUF329 family)